MTSFDSGPAPGGQLGRLGRLVRKELNEILRDRRTIITLVLMPLVLYPLLSIGFRQFALAAAEAAQEPHYRLGFRSGAEALLVGRQLAWRGPAEEVRPTRANPQQPLPGPVPVLQIRAPDLRERPANIGSLKDLLRTSQLDLVILVRNWEQVRGGVREPDLDLQLLYLDGSPRGLDARRWVERQCTLANVHILESRLRRQGFDGRAEPVRASSQAVVDPDQRGGHFLQSLVPLVLILMTITGAVYPAIDLTAGERERGTLEILVAAPVSRLGLLFAKYVTVLAVAVLTALVNLVMMTATLLATGMGTQLFGAGGLSVATILEVFGLLLLFAGFFSAVLLVVASFARSFKEAQAYLIPLMLVSLLPGMLAIKSSLTLTGLLPVVPLLNIVLLARDLFQEQASLTAAGLVVLSTLLYALAALALAARIFGAEAVLYSEQGAWSDLLRRPAEPQPAASVAAALGCVAVLFPVDYLLQGWLGQALGTGPGPQLAGQALLTIFLFVAWPLGWAALGRVRPTTGFQLRAGPPLGYLAALLFGVSLWPLAVQLAQVLREAGLGGTGRLLQRPLQEMVARWRAVSPAWLVLALAVVPAVGEELFFRGYLFGALRARCGPVVTIAATAALFGLFHSFGTLDRVVTSSLLGVVLGAVCWRTGSVFPGMVLHVCHDGIVVLLLCYPEELGWLTADGGGLRAEVLLAGAAGTVLAAGLLWLAGRKGGRKKAQTTQIE